MQELKLGYMSNEELSKWLKISLSVLKKDKE